MAEIIFKAQLDTSEIDKEKKDLEKGGNPAVQRQLEAGQRKLLALSEARRKAEEKTLQFLQKQADLMKRMGQGNVLQRTSNAVQRTVNTGRMAYQTGVNQALGIQNTSSGSALSSAVGAAIGARVVGRVLNKATKWNSNPLGSALGRAASPDYDFLSDPKLSSGRAVAAMQYKGIAAMLLKRPNNEGSAIASKIRQKRIADFKKSSGSVFYTAMGADTVQGIMNESDENMLFGEDALEMAYPNSKDRWKAKREGYQHTRAANRAGRSFKATRGKLAYRAARRGLSRAVSLRGAMRATPYAMLAMAGYAGMQAFSQWGNGQVDPETGERVDSWAHSSDRVLKSIGIDSDSIYATASSVWDSITGGKKAAGDSKIADAEFMMKKKLQRKITNKQDWLFRKSRDLQIMSDVQGRQNAAYAGYDIQASAAHRIGGMTSAARANYGNSGGPNSPDFTSEINKTTKAIEAVQYEIQKLSNRLAP